MTIEAKNVAGSPSVAGERRGSLFRRIGEVFSGRPNAPFVIPTSLPLSLQGSVRIARTTQSFALMLGDISLEFHLDLPITGNLIASSQEWIIHPGPTFYQGVPQFIRLRRKEDMLFGRSDDVQTRIFNYDASVADRHVRITNRKGDLVIQLLELDRSTNISKIVSPKTVWAVRNENLRRLPEVLGRQLVQFDDDEALDIIREINAILAAEIYRDRNDEGTPGGIIKFPDNMSVLIMGDVHARVENILRVIIEGGTLGALERGEVCLVFLGDLVHSEEKGRT